jgi:hypothetical protein
VVCRSVPSANPPGMAHRGGNVTLGFRHSPRDILPEGEFGSNCSRIGAAGPVRILGGDSLLAELPKTILIVQEIHRISGKMPPLYDHVFRPHL